MKVKLSFENKRTRRIALALVAVAGVGLIAYSHHQEEKRMQTGINMLACSYYMATETHYKTLGNCLKEGERKYRIYKSIDDNEEKLKFLTNLCMTGSKSTLSKADCEGFAWNTMYDDE